MTTSPDRPDISIDPDKIAELRADLIAWYRDNARDLPWRRTRDPYRILVSEVMLQQTQVDRVIPKYFAFLDFFPTFEALAAAPTADVIRAWSGLGYNRRAVNLQRTAQAVVDEYGGKMPSDQVQLRDLPGIGPYTAGAIACFAFEQDVGFFDTNIRRVMHRVLDRPGAAEGAGDDAPAAIAGRRTGAARRGLHLEPGADGAGRGRLHVAQARLPDLPAATPLRRLPGHPDRHRDAAKRDAQEEGRALQRLDALSTGGESSRRCASWRTANRWTCKRWGRKCVTTSPTSTSSGSKTWSRV